MRVLEVKSDETEGVVLLMDPGAGARTEEGTEVTVHVAAARFVPEGAVGVPRDEAANLLAAEGFENVTYVTEKSDEHEGLVLSIDPAPGTKATASTPITVTVAEPLHSPRRCRHDVGGGEGRARRRRASPPPSPTSTTRTWSREWPSAPIRQQARRRLPARRWS